MTSYVINEHFAAFQGEGVHMGRRAYFIRLHGCDQQCPWCDSAGTWHPEYKTKHPVMNAEEIAFHARERFGIRTNNDFVVVTGGEPTLHQLDDLTKNLKWYGFRTHLETAGHRPITGNWDWITLSPKPFAAHPLADSIARADEFKIIVESLQSLQSSVDCLIDQNRKHESVVWLHPEWSKRNDPDVLRVICDAVQRPPLVADVRAGWQVHKMYGVDQLDPNADARVIPLGGVGNHASR